MDGTEASRQTVPSRNLALGVAGQWRHVRTHPGVVGRHRDLLLLTCGPKALSFLRLDFLGMAVRPLVEPGHGPKPVASGNGMRCRHHRHCAAAVLRATSMTINDRRRFLQT